MKASKYFTAEQQSLIVEAIRQAETDTSGEIRVHVDKHCHEEVLDRAAWLFQKLKMHKTKDRNGVLIYVAVDSKKLAILGDAGINAVVDDNFWENTQAAMTQAFIENRMGEGISAAVLAVGQLLKSYFPYQSNDVNELSDEISFGK